MMFGRMKTPATTGKTALVVALGIVTSLERPHQGGIGRITEIYSDMTKNTKKAH